MDSGVEGVALLTIFVLSAFTGYEVISKVSTVLHTPLLSGANAIHGVILVGAILVAGSAEGAVELVVGLIAVTLAAVNLVGGFVVTDRMLQMFRRGRPALASGGASAPGSGAGATRAGKAGASGRSGAGGKGGKGGGAGGKASRVGGTGAGAEAGSADDQGAEPPGGRGAEPPGGRGAEPPDDQGAKTQGANEHG